MKFIIIMLLAISCVAYPQDFKKATEVCKNNKGVEYIVISGYTLKIYCNNGAEFKHKRNR